MRLSREAGRIYLFWRGDNWKPCVSWSDDEGGTWTKARIVVSARGAGGGNRPYMKVASDGTERIHLAFTDGHPRNEPTNSIHYACYRDGAFFRADGSRICGMDSVPFEQRSADVVYDGRPDLVRAWIWDVAPDSAGRPVVVYARLPAEDDHRYCYARWDGERWRDGEIVAAGPWFPETAEGRREREPHYSGGIVLDHSDPSVVYLSRRIEGVFEIERWSTPDGGATWSAQRVTSGSEKNNVRPFVARGGRPGERGLFWMHGRYVHYTRYDTCIKMK